MAVTQGAVLVAEIGSLITRVTLIDQVDGESRMIGQATASSSVEPPYQNALYAILEAAAQISENTGRQILRDGQLIMPQGSERDGVNQVIVLSSAAGTMALVITAIASDVSARSALHASRATYTSLLQVVTLDDAATQPGVSAGDLSWIERQVQSLLNLRPDAVLIAGGLEHGAVDAVNRLAHIVGLTALSTAVDASGQQRQEFTTRPVIYAGNSDARERVIEALSDRAEIFVVDNLRPSLDREQLEPARQELSRLYEKQILPRLPGLAGLRRMGRSPVRTVCDVQGLTTRFLAERSGRQVLLVDVGAGSSAAFYAAPGRYHPAVLGNCGVAYGISYVLAARGLAAVARWLPFAMSDAELTHRLLNKILRPHLLPASREDLYIEHAVAREALSMVAEALHDETAYDDYDWLIAGGGVLASAPQPGLALLTLLDALQPAASQKQPILDVHLDTLGLAQVSGALAASEPDAAVTVFDRDLRANVPLATCVVPLGDGRAGDVAVEVELSVVGGRSERRTVHHGEIVRLPLSQGRFAQLTMRPGSGVHIGQAGSGEEVATDPGEIAGSVLGVVIDARGRPLQLPSDDRQRRARLMEWLVALGVERGSAAPVSEPAAVSRPISQPRVSKPISQPGVSRPISQPMISRPISQPAETPIAEAAGPLESAAGEVVPSGTGGRRISLSDLAAQEEAPAETDKVAPGARISLSDLAAQEAQQSARPTPPSPQASKLDNDLDALRQTVEAPKRRGLFGRKK